MQVPDLAPAGPRTAAPARRDETGRGPREGARDDFGKVLDGGSDTDRKPEPTPAAERAAIAQSSAPVPVPVPAPDLVVAATRAAPDEVPAPVPGPGDAIAALAGGELAQPEVVPEVPQPVPPVAGPPTPQGAELPMPAARAPVKGLANETVATQAAVPEAVTEAKPEGKGARPAPEAPPLLAQMAKPDTVPKSDPAPLPAAVATATAAAIQAPVKVAPENAETQDVAMPRVARTARAEPTAPKPAAQASVPQAAEPRPALPEARPATELLARDEAPAAWRLAAGQAHAAAQTAPQPIAQALAGQITLAVGRANDRHVEIRLDPPELGRVHIHLNPTEGGLQAVVLAERPETHDLLRRHAETLARDLSAAGYDNVSLDFAPGGEAAAGRDEAPDPTQSVELSSAAPEPAATPAAPVRRGASGSLDIRL